MESLFMRYEDQHAVTEGWRILVKISIVILTNTKDCKETTVNER